MRPSHHRPAWPERLLLVLLLLAAGIAIALLTYLLVTGVRS